MSEQPESDPAGSRRPPSAGAEQPVSQEQLELVREVFDAFNSGEVDRIVAFAHPELEIEIPAEISAEPDVYRGPEGMQRYIQSFQDAMEEIRFHPERLWSVGQAVVVALRVTAKGRQTSIAVEQLSAGVWTFRDRKVLRIRAYASSEDALDAARHAQ